MLIDFIYGPKCGIKEHVSREVGAALITGGFAAEIAAAPDPIKNPPPPPPGWSIVFMMAGLERVARIQHITASGERFLYDGPPGPTRRWKYDEKTGSEGYILEPSSCPVAIIEQYRQLAGGVVDPEVEAEMQHQETSRLEAAMQKQNGSGNRLW